MAVKSLSNNRYLRESNRQEYQEYRDLVICLPSNKTFAFTFTLTIRMKVIVFAFLCHLSLESESYFWKASLYFIGFRRYLFCTFV